MSSPRKFSGTVIASRSSTPESAEKQIKLDAAREIIRHEKFCSMDISQKKSILQVLLKKLIEKGFTKEDLVELRLEFEQGCTNRTLASSVTKTTAGYDVLEDIQSLVKEKSDSFGALMIVYILGAGPVGLLTAIKLIDLYKENVVVVFFEKREVYTRERVLFINSYILNNVLPKELLTHSKLAEYGCILENLPNRDLATCGTSDNLKGPNKLAISTRALEDDLKSVLDLPQYKSQVRFIYHDGIDQKYIETVNEKFTPHVFIGADGGNLSTKLYPNQLPATEKLTKDIYRLPIGFSEHDLETRKITYGIVAQFIPEEGDTHPRKDTRFPTRQNRYRVFRQQFKNYHKQDPKNKNRFVDEPLSYYIAIQINEAERNQVVKELGDKEWVQSYTMGDSSSKGKYLDRLLYDASRLYNFTLKPGRKFNGLSVFELNVAKMNPENYSRMITINSPYNINRDGAQEKRYIWFPLIGDSILSVNFFSGTGVNAGFGMIEPLVKSLELVTTSPQEQFPRTKIFTDSSRIALLIYAYRKGLDDDLLSGGFMIDDPGLDQVLFRNVFMSYLDYATLIRNCDYSRDLKPEEINRVMKRNKDAGIELELIDLDHVEGYAKDNMGANNLYLKAEDRFCLIANDREGESEEDQP